ncbi:DUF1998 domain-containing protein [Nostoc sp. WHI]|uniref:DUF1998 domain-containing protein n=1 Tax=Nostoc sp. WHI TaxID=2650611 RepID=UPI0018C4DD92|nr:DUF1998 domain-containing protein [Nostoc sp. WHI]MBG1269293.1 DUF1998 domain-containing protein [Nostoc sp. WHI]
MASKGQSLRPSQYITTFGPGSILETPDGPVVIAAPSQSKLFDNGRRPEDYEITDLRLSQTLLNGNKIFYIPSNADLGKPESISVYQTYHFPTWSLCTKHGILYQHRREEKVGCPSCGQLQNSYKAWDKSREEAVRFVLACSHGHLNEVPWRSLIKHKRECQGADFYKWEGGGGAIRNIQIICPNCGGAENFGKAYSREFQCSGRFPERREYLAGCEKRAKIIQRGAANLRVSELRTALTIPPLDTALHRLLQCRAILAALPMKIESKSQIIQMLDDLVTKRLLNQTSIETIKRYSEREILDAANDVLNEQTRQHNATEENLKQEEFKSLSNAACYGAPPHRSDKPGGPNQFEVYHENVETFTLDSGRILRVTPLSRLRVVMVQVGYTRPISTDKDDPQPKVVPVEYRPPDESIAWHPGVELFGEGIFLDLISTEEPKGISEHFPLKGSAYSRWLSAYNSTDGYRKIKAMPGSQTSYLHPVFVWWHTLSHRLITALSVDSGYSSAAIRERVYTYTENNKTVGGLLLYTAQSGGDGTLGGLIGLVPHFERILKSALRNVDACSNDPICIEEEFGEDRVNGSACYACQFISETSCEHRNTLLDRQLLLENLP